MATNGESKCKLCRRAGEKLFLKGEKCATPKCPVVRKPYAPGVHGGKGRQKSLSEYGKQLLQKQKVRRIYGVSEKQFRKHLKEATSKKGVAGDNLVGRLELRLDNVVFRLGLADSRARARQIVKHGHFIINGKKLDIPSACLKVGDEISIKQTKLEKKYFADKKMILGKNAGTPSWLSLDPKKMTGKILAAPVKDETEVSVDMQEVVEFYSR
ncbi:MAG: 30S ribosomal protein S4 [Candidatus Moranbacteria bacterium]|nr:30S ribosomal protein S4 [Candidatus Moranbacteria bacterium]